MLETPVKPKTAKEILEGAHRIVSAHGHCKARFFDVDGSVCTIGAMSIAEGGSLMAYSRAASMTRVSEPMAEALRAMGFSYPGEACEFNNRPDTTKETVLAKFKEGLAKL